MRKIILLSIIFFCLQHLSAQVIYISTTNNRLYRLDIVTCDYVQIVQVGRSLTDISFHPDGTLYGIASSGALFVIDTITGATTTIHTFNGQAFNSLTTSADGIIYATGDQGALWSYNPSNNQARYYGLIGFRATGDLTFYKGKLYVATQNQRIVLIDILNPSNSQVVVSGNIHDEIFGIVSYASSCDSINCYAISSGQSEIYEIDFTSKTLQLVCQLNIRVGGGASTYEFYGSAPIILDTVITTNPSCNHDDGSITINVTGGIAPLSYSINGIDFQSLNTFTNLKGGNYQFIVSDANGCAIIDATSLSNTDGPQITNLVTNPTTCGNSNGEIDVLVQGGNGPIGYSLDGMNFQASPMFTNLNNGKYLITIQDATGCMAKDSADIISVEPTTIQNVNVTPAGCVNNTGSLIILVDKNSSGIKYSVDGVNFQTSNHFDHLFPGIYHLTIQDDNGCIDTISATVQQSALLSIDQIQTMSSSCGENNGSIIITSNGGGNQIEYSINGGNFQSANRFDDLIGGSYLVTIQDENGCKDTSTITIDAGIPLLIDNIESVAPRCDVNDGSIFIIPNGGTGQIMYSIDGVIYQNSNMFSNLGSGSYSINVIDEAGCTATSTIEMNESNSLSIQNVITHPSECGEKTGTVLINATGGIGQITITLDGGPTQTNNLFQHLGAGDYILTITDENGCSLDTSIHIGQLRCEIYIPNTFSPNQDGVNDFFQLFTSDDSNIQIQKYLIFDRWGNLVYSASDFPISSTEFWWDGTFKRLSMGPGVYAYYIEVAYEGGDKEIFKGSVTLIK